MTEPHLTRIGDYTLAEWKTARPTFQLRAGIHVEGAGWQTDGQWFVSLPDPVHPHRSTVTAADGKDAARNTLTAYAQNHQSGVAA